MTFAHKGKCHCSFKMKIEFPVDSVNWYWITFWEILFLRCLSEKCQGFGNELWFFGFREPRATLGEVDK